MLAQLSEIGIYTFVKLTKQTKRENQFGGKHGFFLLVQLGTSLSDLYFQR